MIVHSNDNSRETENIEIPLLLKKGIFSRSQMNRSNFCEALDHSASLVNEVEKTVKAFRKIKYITGYLFKGIRYISLLLTLLTLGLVAWGALTDDKVLMYVPMMVYVILVFITCYFYFRYKTRAEILLREAKEEADKILLSYLPGFNTFDNVLTIMCRVTSRDFFITFKLLKIAGLPADISSEAQNNENSSLAATTAGQRGGSIRFRNTGQVSPFKSMLKPIAEIPIHEIRINNVTSPIHERKSFSYDQMDNEKSGMVSIKNREVEVSNNENERKTKPSKPYSVNEVQQSKDKLDESNNSILKRKKSEQMRVSVVQDELISVKNSQVIGSNNGKPTIHSTKL